MKAPQRDKCRRILNHFGIESQRFKALEELCELGQAIAKDDREMYVEERADVLIMLRQLDIKYNITHEEGVDAIDYKLERTIQRYGIPEAAK